MLVKLRKIDILKKIEECDFYRITNVDNVIILLEDIHKNILYHGIIKMKNKLEELKLYYCGINSDIKQISHLCPTCLQKNISYI